MSVPASQPSRNFRWFVGGTRREERDSGEQLDCLGALR